MSLPIHLVIHHDASTHTALAQVVDSYHEALGGFGQLQGAYAHVKLSEATKDRLPDLIDVLYDKDVHPLVTKSEKPLFLSPLYQDLHTTASFDQIHAAPYVLLVNGDSPIKSHDDMFLNHVVAAMETLAKNRDVITVDVLSFGTPTQTIFSQMTHSPLRVTVMRTRDLYLITKLALDNQSQFGSAPYERAFNSVAETLSQHPFRHLAFSAGVATLT